MRSKMIQIPDQKLKELLIKDQLVAPELFEEVLKDAQRMDYSVADVLISRNIITFEYYLSALANYFGVEKANLLTRPIDENILKLLPEDLARQKRAIIFSREPDGALQAAMEDPSDLNIIEFLEKALKASIKPFLASPDDLNKGFALYGQRTAEDFKKLIEENIKATLRSRAAGAKEAAVELPVVAIVDNILNHAVSLRASDIHIEILEEGVLIRYRIDGILHEIIRMPKPIHPSIIARIKLLAGLKLDEHFKPQDGRFRYKIGNDLIDTRVAVMPVLYGEKIEMRLLAATQRPLSSEELGMFEDTIKLITENIFKTYGMVLVCGPTGSGKTTTLYSVLNTLNRPEVNIVTVEDPIEYDMKYINQTQINPVAGITFANGLRAILRQDPNVIMVGEIRDEETAEIAVQAALTGHLVLSSLHTNDAVTAVPRLIDMKIEPFLVAAVLNAIEAQRLVRRICQDCRVSYKPGQEILEAIKQQMKELNLESKFAPPQMLYKGAGCYACANTGYKGRLGIFEVLNVSEQVRKLIVSPSFSLDALRDLARKEGMITMFEDGLRKVEQGVTTLEEVFRVIRE